MSQIVCDNLVKIYKVADLEVVALQGLDLTVDVGEFIAIINPPQAAILAIGSIHDVPVVEDGEIVPGKRMNITLSADHRVTDGAEVARYLQAVKRYLENPLTIEFA